MSTSQIIKTTIIHQILPWILPKKIHDLVVLVADSDNTKQIKALRWTLSAILKHQKLQANQSDDRLLLDHIQVQNIQMLSQLTDLQRGVAALAHQNRLQQEDHFALERRLMEMKFGQDPMLMSSDSVFSASAASLEDSICIQAINIEQARKPAW